MDGLLSRRLDSVLDRDDLRRRFARKRLGRALDGVVHRLDRLREGIEQVDTGRRILRWRLFAGRRLLSSLNRRFGHRIRRGGPARFAGAACLHGRRDQRDQGDIGAPYRPVCSTIRPLAIATSARPYLSASLRARSAPAAPPGGDGARRAEGFFRERRGMGRAEEFCADRIGPQHAGAIGRPEPARQWRGRVHGKPGIADASQLEIRTRHPTGFKSCVSVSGPRTGPRLPGMTALRKG
ncbi:hypothetical protein [Bradyrhizobium sp. SEMIA]|uniref:hypothetical protein n=1 Tax=Bradyrhizobium sp. SEMIA TaxID=2597515 RepID=UPI003A0FE329